MRRRSILAVLAGVLLALTAGKTACVMAVRTRAAALLADQERADTIARRDDLVRRLQVDSGPVMLGLSMSGTGFAVAGARHAHDEWLAGERLDTAEIVGTTVAWGGERRYLLAPLVGDAILLAMKTARVWDGRWAQRAGITR